MKTNVVQFDLDFIANAPLAEIKSGKIVFPYCIIGKPRGTVARNVETLERMGRVGVYARRRVNS
jgi:hypothetical protein